MRHIAIALCLVLASPAFAAGGNDSAPPKPSQTSKDCTKDQIWDDKAKACAPARDGRFNDDARYRAVRELAWAGQPERALTVLATMTEGETDRVLTYKGFANRKAGRIEEGLAQYDRALRVNPDNILARSYLGQLYVEMAELDLARAQLAEIRSRGGAGTWAETALASAITTGKTLSY